MDQRTAMAVLKAGANVFLTGDPGSGKTHTVNEYVKYLRSHGILPAITASTGIAATHLNGMTIHSWSGIGVKKVLTEGEARKLASNRRVAKRVEKAKVLIIDEVSMLDATRLDLVDSVLQLLKRSEKPFGGMQVVLVGDFFQLPPVARADEPEVRFAFESEAWQAASPVVCYLSEQHRQQDSMFGWVLSAIRCGEVDQGVFDALATRVVEAGLDENHTRLYTHNRDVDQVNDKRLVGIEGEEKEWMMESAGPKPLVEQLVKGCLSPERLVLKKGARVMFTRNNFEEGFVNGTLGEVVAFDEGVPVVQSLDGRMLKAERAEWEISDGEKVLAVVRQVPLRLAWAITVHKSQGMTLGQAVMDLERTFAYGQGYVALSRVGQLADLYLLGFGPNAVMVDPRIVEQDKVFKGKSKKVELAVARLEENELKRKWESFLLACGGELKVTKAKRQMVAKKGDTYETTQGLFKQGLTIGQMATNRGFTRRTIVGHLEKLSGEGKVTGDELKRVVPKLLLKELPKMRRAFEDLGFERLRPVYEHFDKKYSYEELQLARMMVRE